MSKKGKKLFAQIDSWGCEMHVTINELETLLTIDFLCRATHSS
jgi:hypothetical protein